MSDDNGKTANTTKTNVVSEERNMPKR